jgi:hypothetical protein
MDLWTQLEWMDDLGEWQRWLPWVIALVWWLLSLFGSKKSEPKEKAGRTLEAQGTQPPERDYRPIVPR